MVMIPTMVMLVLSTLVITLVVLVDAGSLYSLMPPPVYVVFMGPLNIGYRIPANVSLPHAFVRLEFQGKSPETSKLNMTMGLILGKKEATLTVACGVLEVAGTYTLMMYTRVGGEVLTKAEINVVWPDVVLSLPDFHKAQTVNVELRVLSNANCSSVLHRIPLFIKILFQRKFSTNTRPSNNDMITDSKQHDKHPQKQQIVLPNAEIISTLKFSSLTKPFSTVTLMCHLFDVDGFYQVIIQSAAPESPLVAKSNIMTVEWSGQYFLSVPSLSIFPCKDAVTVTYAHPPCSFVDKMRLYSLNLTAEGSMASPLMPTLLTEREALPDQSKMRFDCDVFNKSAAGFLFVYVSVTRKRRIYYEQTKMRISAWPNSEFPVDGGWSQWAPWSSCSELCGVGKMSRVRMCDNPRTRHGGKFCSGMPFQWKPCSQICPEVIPVSPLTSLSGDQKCACGCTFTEPEGEIIATGRCYDLSVWIIDTEDDWVVSLTFGYFDLNHTRQVVRIRDGSFFNDALIFSSMNSGYPMEIVSSGPTLRVELITHYLTPQATGILPKEATLPIHAQGFVAHYRSRGKGVVASVLYPYEEKTLLGSTITILGIVLCIVIIVATVIFAVIQRTCLQKKVKYTSAPVGESPAHGLGMSQSDNHKHQAHLSTSQHSSSNTSSPDGGTMLVDMEKPLTRKKCNSESSGKYEGSGKKQSKSPKPLSRSSTSSNKIKLFRPSTSSESSSPKPCSRDYISVKSKNGIEIVDTDECNGSKSDSKSNTTLASPYIHFKQKKFPLTASPQVSKFDMLSKEQKGRKSSKSLHSKSITDASSDASSQKSRSVTTTMAEVNWPQSNFVRSAWNEMGKPFYDRHRPGQRPPSEEIPLIDTTSQESSPSHVNNLVKSESTDSASSSFIQSRSSKARRPTSLTESYSSVQSKCDDLTISESPSGETVNDTDTGTLRREDVLKPSPFETPSSSLTPTFHIPLVSSSAKTPTLCLTKHSPSATITPTQNLTPHQPSCNSPLTIIIPKNTYGKDSKDKSPSSLIIDPHKLSSPSLHISSSKHQSKKHELSCADSHNQRLRQLEEASPSRISKCSSRDSKTTVYSSPTRSITTPSEIDGLELEYDDFIEDDPLSYFDYEETQKLAFRGSEKIGKSPIAEDEEDDKTSQGYKSFSFL